MAGEINFGILDTNAPGKIATSFIQGQQLGQQYRAQELQNQIADAQYQNMLAKQEAYKEAGGDMNKLVQSLTNRGLAEDAIKLRKDIREEAKAGVELKLNEAKLHREDLSALYGDPSDANFAAYLEKNKGRFTPQQVQQAVNQWQAAGTPEARQKMLLPQVLTMDQYVNHLDRQEQQKISRGNLAVAQQRLSADLQSGAGALTPETVDMVANIFLKTGQLPQLGMGKQAAAARQQILNRATVLGTTGAEGQPAPTAADVAGNVVSAKQDYKSQEKATKDFATGIQGRQVNSFNTAIDHLSTMDKLSDALANGDTKAINAIGNMVAKQTGAPAPTSFNAAKQIVTAEVIKSIVASGGGVKERQEAEANFAAANSPAQLKGVINAYKDLMGGQLKSLELQYGNTTGRKDFEKKLTPAAKEELSKVKSNLTGQDAAALEWAKANPNDPRATKIKQRLGVQ